MIDKDSKETLPITPAEVLENRDKYIHPDIIRIVNEFLSQHFVKGSDCKILQKTIVDRFVELNPDFGKDKLFKERHMDFEDVYRKQGWKVEYDKPGYNETYEAYFIFSIKI